MGRRLIKDPERYKTQYCKQWVSGTECPYGHKCQFAHGPAELRYRQKFDGTHSKQVIQRSYPPTPPHSMMSLRDCTSNQAELSPALDPILSSDLPSSEEMRHLINLLNTDTLDLTKMICTLHV